jgi:hypothetical protein
MINSAEKTQVGMLCFIAGAAAQINKTCTLRQSLTSYTPGWLLKVDPVHSGEAGMHSETVWRKYPMVPSPYVTDTLAATCTCALNWLIRLWGILQSVGGAGDGLGLSTGLGVGVGSGVGEGDTTGAGLGDTTGAGLGDSSGVGLGEASGLGLGDSSGVGLGEAPGVGLGDSSGVGLGEAPGVGLGDSSGVGLGEAPGVGLGDSCGTGGGLGCGDGRGPGSCKAE